MADYVIVIAFVAALVGCLVLPFILSGEAKWTQHVAPSDEWIEAMEQIKNPDRAESKPVLMTERDEHEDEHETGGLHPD